MGTKEIPRNRLIARTDLPADTTAPGAARKFVKEQLTAYSQRQNTKEFVGNKLRTYMRRPSVETPTTPDLGPEVLWTSEAVTNVVKHAPGAEKIGVGVGVVKRHKDHKARYIVVVEQNTSPTASLEITPTLPENPDAEGGRGLFLMDAMTSESGVQVYSPTNALGKVISLLGRKTQAPALGYSIGTWGVFDEEAA